MSRIPANNRRMIVSMLLGVVATALCSNSGCTPPIREEVAPPVQGFSKFFHPQAYGYLMDRSPAYIESWANRQVYGELIDDAIGALLDKASGAKASDRPEHWERIVRLIRRLDQGWDGFKGQSSQRREVATRFPQLTEEEVRTVELEILLRRQYWRLADPDNKRWSEEMLFAVQPDEAMNDRFAYWDACRRFVRSRLMLWTFHNETIDGINEAYRANRPPVTLAAK